MDVAPVNFQPASDIAPPRDLESFRFDTTNYRAVAEYIIKKVTNGAEADETKDFFLQFLYTPALKKYVNAALVLPQKNHFPGYDDNNLLSKMHRLIQKIVHVKTSFEKLKTEVENDLETLSRPVSVDPFLKKQPKYKEQFESIAKEEVSIYVKMHKISQCISDKQNKFKKVFIGVVEKENFAFQYKQLAYDRELRGDQIFCFEEDNKTYVLLKPTDNFFKFQDASPEFKQSIQSKIIDYHKRALSIFSAWKQIQTDCSAFLSTSCRKKLNYLYYLTRKQYLHNESNESRFSSRYARNSEKSYHWIQNPAFTQLKMVNKDKKQTEKIIKSEGNLESYSIYHALELLVKNSLDRPPHTFVDFKALPIVEKIQQIAIWRTSAFSSAHEVEDLSLKSSIEILIQAHENNKATLEKATNDFAIDQLRENIKNGTPINDNNLLNTSNATYISITESNIRHNKSTIALSEKLVSRFQEYSDADQLADKDIFSIVFDESISELTWLKKTQERLIASQAAMDKAMTVFKDTFELYLQTKNGYNPEDYKGWSETVYNLSSWWNPYPLLNALPLPAQNDEKEKDS